ncbi:unnamed protein product, partial [Nesidiocoris tenuis]
MFNQAFRCQFERRIKVQLEDTIRLTDLKILQRQCFKHESFMSLKFANFASLPRPLPPPVTYSEIKGLISMLVEQEKLKRKENFENSHSNGELNCLIAT